MRSNYPFRNWGNWGCRGKVTHPKLHARWPSWARSPGLLILVQSSSSNSEERIQCCHLTRAAAQQRVIIYTTTLWIANFFWWGNLKKRCFLVPADMALLGNLLSSTPNHFSSWNKTDRYKFHSNEVLSTFPMGQNDTGKLAMRWFYQLQDLTSYRIFEKGFGRTLSGWRTVKGSPSPSPRPAPCSPEQPSLCLIAGGGFLFLLCFFNWKINVHIRQKMKT